MSSKTQKLEFLLLKLIAELFKLYTGASKFLQGGRILALFGSSTAIIY